MLLGRSFSSRCVNGGFLIANREATVMRGSKYYFFKRDDANYSLDKQVFYVLQYVEEVGRMFKAATGSNG